MATFQTGGYPVPPPGFNFDYRTPPHTPAAAGYGYYSPRTYVNTSSTPTSKGHTRRATGDGTYHFNSYPSTTPRKTTRYSTDYYQTSAQSTPQRRDDYVSGSDRKHESTREYRVPAAAAGRHERARTYSNGGQYASTRTKYVVVDDDFYYDRLSQEYLPRYEQYEPRPPPYSHRHQSYRESQADHRYYDQVPVYTTAETTPRSARPRRASHNNNTQPRPPPADYAHRPSTSHKTPAKATDADARRAGIPAGYSYKNWDPTEEPILLLGSVFDANSLGKWIYDWTVFYYGPATPLAEVAGDLWLLLIQLAHKVKRAEDCRDRIRSTSNRDLVDDFLESGERLWQRFNKLLKICENYMWRVAKREAGVKAKVTMGQNSGCEFVDAIFGRDRELERTEKIMAGMRLWSMRFDANCEEILRHPTY